MTWEDLKDKVVIVTGGGKGIGKVYVREFALQGARVVAADIDYEAAKRVAGELKERGAQVLAIEVDVSNEESVLKMVEDTVKTFGDVDVLVNNASLMSALPRGDWRNIPIAEWNKVMEVNVAGPFLCARAVFPSMQRRGKGKIINISSSRVFEGSPNRLHYTTSKAGVIGFTKALAAELAAKGVTVNAVAPGYIATKMVLAIKPEVLQSIIDTVPMKRLGSPEEMGGICVYLASDVAAFMTGATMNINGGLYFQ